MAVKVREGLDYRILSDDYRKEFHKHNNPVRVRGGVPQYRCIYCGRMVPLYSSNNEFPMEVDHIIPKTRMGAGILWNPNKGWNLGSSCKSCNTSKSNKIDARVVKGFINKIKYRYHLGVLANTDEISTEANENPSKWLTFMIVALITVITVLSPIALILTWTLQGLWLMVVRIKELIMKLLRKSGKRVKKSIKKKLYLVLEILIKLVIVIYIGRVLAYKIQGNGWDFVQPLQTMYNWVKVTVATLINRDIKLPKVPEEITLIFNK